ncbi:hypothetical protein RO3G_12769 [Rhizopus delemar RA 99-880]|uniref:Uncharacterized protein n=1 Tax=Rhizopus delemar (strain RA 99-880 / ATCC MYA-4621 / FGSC 9543 / NRRL 43880) TaxID=246409 RepID=I1CHX8_RHIO9|nr:hypothetical protein RO3G_12769 [Rhizopus delemar RA 99-880]|eukprot:EIE88058.1 hypothetical protein RO3G_12769 [Rhizopus delemar RA 99-880]
MSALSFSTVSYQFSTTFSAKSTTSHQALTLSITLSENPTSNYIDAIGYLTTVRFLDHTRMIMESSSDREGNLHHSYLDYDLKQLLLSPSDPCTPLSSALFTIMWQFGQVWLYKSHSPS